MMFVVCCAQMSATIWRWSMWYEASGYDWFDEEEPRWLVYYLLQLMASVDTKDLIRITYKLLFFSLIGMHIFSLFENYNWDTNWNVDRCSKLTVDLDLDLDLDLGLHEQFYYYYVAIEITRTEIEFAAAVANVLFIAFRIYIPFRRQQHGLLLGHRLVSSCIHSFSGDCHHRLLLFEVHNHLIIS